MRLAVALLLAAAAVRLIHLDRAAVEHFDEGVYASNLWFGPEQGYAYPFRELYAPPLFPALVEWSQILLGTTHLGTLAVSLAAGTLTVALVWWVARTWFSPAAGIAAGTLAAFSDYHILYSRAVLTDALVGFWILLAVALAWKSLRQSSVLWAALAGLVTALAWWTKYSGWLPLAITTAALAPWLALPWRNTRGLSPAACRRALLCLAVVAIAAAAAIAPMFATLPEPGYAAVQANHQKYVVGLAGWWNSLQDQAAAQRHLTGWLTCAGFGLAVVLAAWLGRAPRAAASPLPVAGLATLLAGGAALLGAAPILALAAALGLTAILGPSLLRRSDADDNRTLAGWLLAAWFCGLLLAVPFYRPYPRLALPWLIATWIAAGAAVEFLLAALSSDRRSAEPVTATSRRPAVVGSLGLVLGVAALALSLGRLSQRGVPGWQPRTGLETAAARIVADLPRQTAAAGSPAVDAVVYVFGEPGLFYHLANQLAERPIFVQPVGNLGFASPTANDSGIPTYLVEGPHARRSPQFTDDWRQYRHRFREVARHQYAPSDLVLLDQFPPRRALANNRPTEPILLHRLLPTGLAPVEK